ncbi:MAG: indolepyruvate oxidoreductase subunit beta [Kiritimatiellaeota bacterium]|nr:indolepyruvate oxidoreductase subunit beta [Kiritimatiellota bacterium]
MTQNIFLCGVGGQGVLLAAKIVAGAAEISGMDVRTNEIHGMAQRGGSVTAHVRFGTEVFSPLIPEGGADVLGALEHVEALRWAHFLKPDGMAAVNAQSIIPATVSSGAAKYPDDVPERLTKTFPRLKYADCAGMALELGDARCANIILCGMLSTALALEVAAWEESIRTRLPAKAAELNLRAFERGRVV